MRYDSGRVVISDDKNIVEGPTFQINTFSSKVAKNILVRQRGVSISVTLVTLTSGKVIKVTKVIKIITIKKVTVVIGFYTLLPDFTFIRGSACHASGERKCSGLEVVRSEA